MNNGRSRFKPQFTKDAQYKSNSELLIEVECVRLSSDGAGIGYHEGKATFVPELLPGEIGQVRITQAKKKWQRGELLALREGTEAPERIHPPCTVFGKCGGCQLQHLKYEETLAWKKRWVEDALTRIGKIDLSDVTVHPTLGMSEPWRYRNKVRIHRGEDGKLGYYQEKSNSVVRFADCLLISEELNSLIKRIEEVLNCEDLDRDEEDIRSLTFRENTKGEKMVIIEPLVDHLDKQSSEGCESFNASLKMDKDAFIEDVKKDSPSVDHLWGVTKTGEPKLLLGDGDFREEILGFEYKVSPLAFLQVNPEQTRKLYGTALQYADLQGNEVVWDLYCGIGTITLPLAKRAKKVWGIEENPYAIEDAKENALINSVANVEFFTGKVEDTFQQIPVSPEVVVLDPPRAGAEQKVLKGLLKLKPQRIVYVSCDPGTLARDLGILQEGGYKVVEVQPVDMFGWSYHVECIVQIKRAETRMA